jgi:tetratricopeptide (TPR) repeat protein
MPVKLNVFAVGSIGFLMACGSARAASPERWVEARSAHFTVLSDSSEKDAVRLASHFERMRLVFQALLPADDDENALPIMVLAVNDRKGMQALEPAAYLGPGQIELNGFFLHRVDKDYILVRVDAEEAHAYSTVYHEYTHSMLRKASAWMPLWLNEGLAQFYENTDFDDRSARLGQSNPMQLSLLKRSEMLPIATLLTVDAGSPLYHDEEEGSMFYAESWALTHYLIVSDREQGTHRMRDYTERLALGEDSITAATQAFGDLSKLQAGLAAYVMQRNFMYFTMPTKLAIDEKSIAVRPVTEAEADAVRADVMAHTDRTSDAEAVLDRVLQADSNNALAHETMGLLRYRAGDMEGAKKWFAEALAIDPQSYWAHCYLAVAMTRSGENGDDAMIESNLREAIRLNPEFAPAYDALAMFGARRHRDLTEAQGMGMRAVELEPGELSFRLDCAEVMTENKDFASALGVLRQALHLAKTADETAAVHDRIGRVERSEMNVAGNSHRLPLGGEYGSGAGQ